MISLSLFLDVGLALGLASVRYSDYCIVSMLFIQIVRRCCSGVCRHVIVQRDPHPLLILFYVYHINVCSKSTDDGASLLCLFVGKMAYPHPRTSKLCPVISPGCSTPMTSRIVGATSPNTPSCFLRDHPCGALAMTKGTLLVVWDVLGVPSSVNISSALLSLSARYTHIF